MDSRLGDRLIRKDGLVAVPVAGETVVVDEADFRLHYLDEIASAVWVRLDDARSVGEVCDELAELYQAPAREIGADVVRLIGGLVAEGVLVQAPD